MIPTKVARAAGTGASVPVECCQVCGHAPLETVLSLGYMPPVNQMVPIGEVPRQQPWFPTDLLYCPACELVQLGLAVDPVIIFPPEYPYTSGTTKLLRDNFAELYAESSSCSSSGQGRPRHRHRLERRHAAVELPDGRPSRAGHRADRRGKIAQERGIPTIHALFHAHRRPREVKREHGTAQASSPRPIASRISRTCTRSSRASSTCSRPTACSSRNRTI